MKNNTKLFSEKSSFRNVYLLGPVVILCLTFSQCTNNYSGEINLPPSDPDNGGLFLPGGFEALVVADSTGRARHIAVNDNGDIYVKLRSSPEGEPGNVALRDTNGDGKADVIERFGIYKNGGNLAVGMRIHNGYLYYSSTGVVYRQKLTPGKLVPDSDIEVMVTDDHAHGLDHWHIAKPMAFDDKENMYIPFGSPSNACQLLDREQPINRSYAGTPGTSGIYPCPELVDHAGIWKFDANKSNQTQKDGIRISTGIRSVVAIDWNKEDKSLYAAIHGRDNLSVMYPQLYSTWDNAVLPAEEFVKVTEGSDFGWPYYYYDPFLKKRVLSPEYGGDRKKTANENEYTQPLVAFPGHWAPNDLLFYTGNQFPDRYREGAFIVFHGSNNRAPYPQAGYFVCFVPFKNGKPTGKWEVFADGFAKDPIVTNFQAAYQPMGLATGPDGSLYLTDSHKGKIWRIMYKGDKNKFNAADLETMEKRKTLAHIRTPDKVLDDLERGKEESAGAELYNTYCQSCHQADGNGDDNHFPPLSGSEWVKGDKQRLIKIILEGLDGPIRVKGKSYNGMMPQNNFLTNDQIADILTYIRQGFGNNADVVKAEDVKKVRGW
jgi:glucose/arabinose dehydrogenase/cytochrome c553